MLNGDNLVLFGARGLPCPPSTHAIRGTCVPLSVTTCITRIVERLGISQVNVKLPQELSGGLNRCLKTSPSQKGQPL